MSELVAQSTDKSVVAEASGVLTDLQRFEEVVRDQLAAVGLPIGQVFISVSERHVMLSNVSTKARNALMLLDRAAREFTSP